jgi:response regulator of citrate/malate metabolism
MVAERIFTDWFDKYVTPGPSKLWISAIASDAIQGKPQLLQELLQRGVDEPDALARRRASIRFGTCLIAQVLDELQLEPDMLHKHLVKLDYLRYPDSLLEKPIPNAIQEKVEKLIQKGYDPTEKWKEKETSAIRSFRVQQDKLLELFDTESSSITPISVTSFFAEEGNWWGTRRHPEEKIVNLIPQFLFLTPLCEGLLLREAIRHILPQTFQEALDVQEFVNTLVTMLLPDKYQQAWHYCRWGGKPPSQKQMDNFSSISQSAKKILNKGRLPIFLQKLKSIDQKTTSVPERSLTWLSNSVIETEITKQILSKSHQAVLFQLSENPYLSERQLSNQTKLSRGTIRRSLKWLHNQLKLQIIGEINYLRIGLTPLLLLLNYQPNIQTQKNNLDTIMRRLESFSFCRYLLSPLTSMNTGMMAVFALPEKVVPNFINQVRRWSAETNANLMLAKIHRFEWGWNFRWWQKFMSEEWQILSRSQLRETTSPKGYNKNITYEGETVKLTNEILRAIIALEKNIQISTRNLAKTMGVSATTAGNYLKQLISTLLVPRIYINPIHLCENIIFLSSASTLNHLGRVAKYLRLLPLYQFWHLEQPIFQAYQKLATPSLLCTASFPKGGLVPFTTSISNILKEKDATLASQQFILPSIPRPVQGLPIALHDSSKHEWICPPKLLEELFESS